MDNLKFLPENYTIVYDYETGDCNIWSVKSNRFLNKSTNRRYQKISIRTGDKIHDYDIHRLVALYFIPNPENKKYVDHINRDKHDNRIENLRWTDARENTLNSEKHENSKGYSWSKQKQRWRACIRINRKLKHLGYVKTEEEARKLYEKAVDELNASNLL